MKQERDNGLDLLRILCMLMVVCLHAFNHGGLVEGTLVPGTANFYLGNAMFALCLPAVNCFVMISGYFLCTADFKLKKLVSIWGQAFFLQCFDCLHSNASGKPGVLSQGAGQIFSCCLAQTVLVCFGIYRDVCRNAVSELCDSCHGLEDTFALLRDAPRHFLCAS